MELLKKNSSWETSLQGQCHSLARLSLFKKRSSYLDFQGGLSPRRSSPEPGGLSSAVGPPTKRKSQLGSEQSQNPAALPPLLPQDLVSSSELRPPSHTTRSPPNIHTVRMSWARGAGAVTAGNSALPRGIGEPPPVPAGEPKRSPLQAFSLLVASKALAFIHLRRSAPTRPLPDYKSHPAPRFCTALRIALPAAPGAPSSAPASPREFAFVSLQTPMGSRPAGTLSPCLSRTQEALAMRNRAHPHTDLSVGTPSPWHQGENRSN